MYQFHYIWSTMRSCRHPAAVREPDQARHWETRYHNMKMTINQCHHWLNWRYSGTLYYIANCVPSSQRTTTSPTRRLTSPYGQTTTTTAINLGQVICVSYQLLDKYYSMDSQRLLWNVGMWVWAAPPTHYTPPPPITCTYMIMSIPSFAQS